MDDNAKKDFLILALQAFLENSPDMIFMKDTNLVYRAASRSFAQMVGRESGAELVGKTDFDIFDDALARQYVKDDRKILASGFGSENYVEPLPDQKGIKSYSSTSKYVIRDESGNIIGLYGAARDITDQVALVAQAESNSFSRRMLFESVLEADVTEDKILQVEAFGWTQELRLIEAGSFTGAVRTMANRFISLDYMGEFLSRYNVEKLTADFEKGIQEFSHMECVRIRENSSRWIEFRSRVYRSRISNTLRITTFLTDRDDEMRHKQRLQKRAATDALTGLYNRENILECITACLDKAAPDFFNALLFIDLDQFKRVNDQWGHQYGDKVLQKTADRLRQIFRGDDIYGRIGGDEFLVFLRQIPSRETAELRAQEIVEALPLHLAEGGKVADVTCSVGVALCKNGEANVEQLYEQADKAMYRAKEQGRNRYFFYEDMK